MPNIPPPPPPPWALAAAGFAPEGARPAAASSCSYSSALISSVAAAAGAAAAFLAAGGGCRQRCRLLPRRLSCCLVPPVRGLVGLVEDLGPATAHAKCRLSQTRGAGCHARRPSQARGWREGGGRRKSQGSASRAGCSQRERRQHRSHGRAL